MGFKYIDALATSQNLEKLATFTDMVAGVRQSVSNVFDIEDALRDSPLMQRCLKKVQSEPASAKFLGSVPHITALSSKRLSVAVNGLVGAGFFTLRV